MRWRLAVWPITLLLIPRTAFSPSCMTMSFENCIRRSSIIFAGTVDHMGPAPSIPNEWDRTRYRFRNVDLIKGSGSVDSLIVTQSGGPATGSYVDGEFYFEVGRRYIVLAYERGREPGAYGAHSCCQGNPFGVWPDSASDVPVVHASGSRALVGIDSLHIAYLWNEPWRSDMGVWVNGAPPPKPPRADLGTLIQRSDSLDLREGRAQPTDSIRWVVLFPHQDTGTRVSETQFKKALSRWSRE